MPEAAARRAARAVAARAIERRHRRRRLGGLTTSIRRCARGARRESTAPAVDGLATRAAEHLRRAGVAAFDRDDWSAASSLLAARERAPAARRARARGAPAQARRGARLARRARYRARRARRGTCRRDGDRRRAAGSASALKTGARADDRRGDRCRRTRCSATSKTPSRPRAVPAITSALAMAELVRFHALDRAGLPELGAAVGGCARSREKGERAPDRAPRHELDLHHAARGHRPGRRRDRKRPGDRRRRPPRRTSRVRARRTRPPAGAEGRVRGGAGVSSRRPDGHSRSSACGRRPPRTRSLSPRSRLMADDDAAAERVLRDGFEALSRIRRRALEGKRRVAIGAAARAARAKTTRRSASRASRSASATPGLWVDVWWRIVLALVEANRGPDARRAGSSERRAPHRVRVRESRMHADALLECAEALRAVGRKDEAAAPRRGGGRDRGAARVCRRARRARAQRALTA